MIVVVVTFDLCRLWDGGHMSIVMANLSASITWKVTVFIVYTVNVGTRQLCLV